jgi:hypothetical protein
VNYDYDLYALNFQCVIIQCINGCEVHVSLCFEPCEDENLFVKTYVGVSDMLYTDYLPGAFVSSY